jgi:hypothetical protein
MTKGIILIVFCLLLLAGSAFGQQPLWDRYTEPAKVRNAERKARMNAAWASEAPDSVQPRRYWNELGIDATAFVKRFLNFGTDPFYLDFPYYVTYRRHFRFGNIRFAIGGTFRDYDISAPFDGDTNSYHANASEVNARIGWEFFTDLDRRWQAFYGVDFRPTFVHDKNDAPYWNGGYANGREVKYRNLGIAALLGIRYRLTRRVSLSTETHVSLNFSKEDVRRYYIPVTSQYPPQADEIVPTEKRTLTYFMPPISLFFTFDL